MDENKENLGKYQVLQAIEGIRTRLTTLEELVNALPDSERARNRDQDDLTLFDLNRIKLFVFREVEDPENPRKKFKPKTYEEWKNWVMNHNNPRTFADLCSGSTTRRYNFREIDKLVKDAFNNGWSK